MTLVACTYLDIDTHTRTKKRDSVFRKANIFVSFVFVGFVDTHICVCAHVCALVQMEDEGLRQCPHSLSTLLFYFFEVGPLTNLEFTNHLDWLVCRAQESPCSGFPALK